MQKEEAIQKEIFGHERLTNVLLKLTEEQITQYEIIGDWTVKDILNHIIAWNRRVIPEIDAILNDEGAWVSLGEEELDTFNKEVVQEGRDLDIKEVLKELELSSREKIAKILSLTEDQWNYTSKGHFWKNGDPLSVKSIFEYEYKDNQHEASHAKEIEDYFLTNDAN